MRIFTKFHAIAPVITGIAVFSIAVSADAATASQIITSSQDVVTIFCGALAWMFWGLMVLGVVMFLLGGYTYATAQGDPEKVSQATKTLTYAAVALVVGIVAKGVPVLIGSFFGLSASQLSSCS